MWHCSTHTLTLLCSVEFCILHSLQHLFMEPMFFMCGASICGQLQAWSRGLSSSHFFFLSGPCGGSLGANWFNLLSKICSELCLPIYFESQLCSESSSVMSSEGACGVRWSAGSCVGLVSTVVRGVLKHWRVWFLLFEFHLRFLRVKLLCWRPVWSTET